MKKIRLKYMNYIGHDYYYPDNDAAALLLELCEAGVNRKRKRKTFTKNDIKRMELLEIPLEILKPKITYEWE